MRVYPLLVKFNGSFFGRGFVAAVSIRGRLIAAKEGEHAWWFYGVNPGAIAAHGDSLDDAHEEFRAGFEAVVIQFADESGSFDAFKREVERFVRATNEPTAAEWDTAVKRVRATHERLQDLPVNRADEFPVEVVVVQKRRDTFTPDDNRIRVRAELAEAA